MNFAALKFWAVMITLAVVMEAFLIAGSTPTPTPLPLEHETTANQIVVRDQIHGTWLIVRQHRRLFPEGNTGWDPAFTMIESDFKPVVKQNGKKWEIVFSTEDTTKDF